MNMDAHVKCKQHRYLDGCILPPTNFAGSSRQPDHGRSDQSGTLKSKSLEKGTAMNSTTLIAILPLARLPIRLR